MRESALLSADATGSQPNRDVAAARQTQKKSQKEEAFDVVL